MREVLSQLTSTLASGKECVYCAVVETRGSTPQKPGAAMLVFPDGGQVGTLGGGCVEAEVRQRALRAMGSGQPEVHVFNLDDNYGWDDGLICGGRMTILADPFPSPTSALAPRREAAGEYYRRFRERVEQGLGCTEAVVMSEQMPGTHPGQRFLFDDDARLIGQVGDDSPTAELIAALPPLRERPRPSAQRGIAYLPVLPRVTLLIVGGGHVGQAVARLGADVDFGVWVVDDREGYASAERFPTAERRIVGDIGPTLQRLVPELTPSFFALVVTRGHAHDEEALYHLARSQAGYVGMIGSKRKIKLIYEDLIAKGIAPDALTRVHAPLGFNIGSQTVPEIAVSIVAELIACRNLGQTIAAARIQVPVGNHA
jgi:xanthine dehydrogenase accessory factor